MKYEEDTTKVEEGEEKVEYEEVRAGMRKEREQGR